MTGIFFSEKLPTVCLREGGVWGGRGGQVRFKTPWPKLVVSLPPNFREMMGQANLIGTRTCPGWDFAC